MTPRILSSLLLALFACAPSASASTDGPSPAATASKAADFSWSGTVKAGGAVELANVTGDLVVVPAKGKTVRVTAEISGRDAGIAKVVVDDSGSKIRIRTDLGRKRNTDVRVDYRIEVPRGVGFAANVVSGNIETRGVTGPLALQAVSGNVEARGSGDLEVSTVSGNAKVVLPKGTRRAALEAVNGKLELSVPSGLGLDLAATSLNGRIDAEIDHERSNQLVGSEVKISRGDRAATVRLETVNGRIKIVEA